MCSTATNTLYYFTWRSVLYEQTKMQLIMYLGVQLESISLRTRLSQEPIRDLMSALNTFRLGHPVALKEYQRLLGRIATAASVCHLGLLYMRPLQIWLKTQVPRKVWKMGRARVVVTHRCLNALKSWRNPDLYQHGTQMGMVMRRKVVTVCRRWAGELIATVYRLRSTGQSEKPWHINRLELRAVFLALLSFITQVQGHQVLIRTDNMLVVTYINQQGGVHSGALYRQAASLLLWANYHLLSIRARSG